MLRELIQQIELQKLAEQDPEAFLAEITKLAFFDELEQIKEAGALREGWKILKGAVTGRGVQPAREFVPAFKGHTQAIRQAVGATERVNPRGVVEQASWNPMTQNVQRGAHAGHVKGWTQGLQPTPAGTLGRAERATEAANVMGAQQRRAWELQPVVGPAPAGFRR